MLIFYAGARYTKITVVLSHEEYQTIDDLAVRYPDVNWYGVGIRVADEAARDAWIAAMDDYAEAADALGGICGERNLPFEKRDEYTLIMRNALKRMQALVIKDDPETSW